MRFISIFLRVDKIGYLNNLNDNTVTLIFLHDHKTMGYLISNKKLRKIHLRRTTMDLFIVLYLFYL